MGPSGMKAIKDFLADKVEDVSDETITSVIDEMPDVGQHKDGDYILADEEEINVKKK